MNLSILPLGPFHFCRDFRALIPGAGTNGGVPYLGEQLNHTDSEILYIDFSSTSMFIAQERIKMRGVSKIVWAIDWIENIPRLGIGYFNFVGCTGVLHHLKNPQHGLKIVHDVQTDNGGAVFMLYGTYGRTGIYQVQELMRITSGNNHSINKELKLSKITLQCLSTDHWFHHIPYNDIDKMGDTGLYDLLLHKRDVSYTIPEVFDWVQQTGYNFVQHTVPK